LPVVVLRPAYVYGPGDQTSISETRAAHAGDFRHFASAAATRVLPYASMSILLAAMQRQARAMT
jgi:hypothetical protein